MFTIARVDAHRMREYALHATIDTRKARWIVDDLRVGLGELAAREYEEDTYDALLLLAKDVWRKMDLPVADYDISLRLLAYERPSREGNKFFEKLAQRLEQYTRYPDSARGSRSSR